MDALVEAALAKVNEAVKSIPWDELREVDRNSMTPNLKVNKATSAIAKANYAVDALKSALKSL